MKKTPGGKPGAGFYVTIEAALPFCSGITIDGDCTGIFLHIV
jgi:hypothetical protein